MSAIPTERRVPPQPVQHLLATPRHALPTKLLHAALGLSVLWQLIGSNLMHRPKIGRPGNFFYEVHEIVGLLTLGLVLAFWLWAVLRQRGTPVGALLPWFSAARRSALIADARGSFTALRERRVPAHGTEAPLASAVHGLGLLTALAMGATGAWLFTLAVPAGLVLEAHKVIANLMWAYLIGHAGIAVLYQFTKQPVLKAMFTTNAAQHMRPTERTK